MSTTTTYTDADLTYAATFRCPCGAGLAYAHAADTMASSWDCADILTGRAIPAGRDGAVTHTSPLPFAFWEVKSERQSSAYGMTTRPASQAEEVAP
jgi:hypothetical protein